jgi:hypothetical protein
MANDDHIAQLMKGPVAWNAWRRENSKGMILSTANLGGADLRGADLRGASSDYSMNERAPIWPNVRDVAGDDAGDD